ncbi:MAG: molybdenum cofactor guanylyltransferase [Bacteroidetes bacterium]|nr:molybdenum cofactor guanylyltransferase [Bacteroidota bacterium]
MIRVGSKITGIVLAGGKSSRMGTDKGVVEINGKKIIQYVIDVLKEVSDEILIIANNNNYNDLGFKVYKDIVKEHGPLGGIYTWLYHSLNELNVVVSCDTPLITKEVLLSLIENIDDNEIIVSRENGNIHPLCAVYKKQSVFKIKKQLDNGHLKLQEVVTMFKTRFLDFDNEAIFSNLNTKEDVEKLIFKTSKK